MPGLGYRQVGGGGGVSGFTSNLRRSKSLRYSMARGLGGREGSGRDEDITVSTGNCCCLSVLKGHNNKETIMCQIV